MHLYFLGTGAGRPSKQRNVASIAMQLPEPSKEIWLFDCGEGTQHQVLRSPFNLRQISRIFITHLHGDHILGLPGLLASRSFYEGEKMLTIYGPQGIKEFVQTTLDISATHLRYPLDIMEVEEENELEIASWQVKVTLLEHIIPSFGYSLNEPDRPGKLNVSKLQELGLRPGPIYGQLKEGKQVEINGFLLDGKDFVGPPQKGRKIVILGDTRYCEATIRLAKDADVLVHEATFSAELEEKAFKYHHSTTVQAAQVAKEANCKQLILTHLSSRYQRNSYEELLVEARGVFSNTCLAEDHMYLEIKRSND